MSQPVLFALEAHPLQQTLRAALEATPGASATRHFPDGETYLRIETPVARQHCIILADLVQPDRKFLPLLFLADTLRELGAASVGLVAPYLAYMRQDCRFAAGEAVTSRIFARHLSGAVDWLVTVDPHLHRYHALAEIYRIPTRVVHGAPLLARYLTASRATRTQPVLLVGPDAESEQWVAGIAAHGGLPFVVGSKERSGDRKVAVSLPDLARFRGHEAVIVDDVISSGHTILQCMDALRAQHLTNISCMTVHGLFADGVDRTLSAHGLKQLVSTNTVAHASNAIDVTEPLAGAVRECLHGVGTIG